MAVRRSTTTARAMTIAVGPNTTFAWSTEHSSRSAQALSLHQPSKLLGPDPSLRISPGYRRPDSVGLPRWACIQQPMKPQDFAVTQDFFFLKKYILFSSFAKTGICSGRVWRFAPDDGRCLPGRIAGAPAAVAPVFDAGAPAWVPPLYPFPPLVFFFY